MLRAILAGLVAGCVSCDFELDLFPMAGDDCRPDPCIVDGCREVIARVPSPDGKRIALLFQTNGGATTDVGAEVCVGGREVALGYHSAETRISWDSPTLLRVEQLTNGAPPHVVDVTKHAVACEPPGSCKP